MGNDVRAWHRSWTEAGIGEITRQLCAARNSQSTSRYTIALSTTYFHHVLARSFTMPNPVTYKYARSTSAPFNPCFAESWNHLNASPYSCLCSASRPSSYCAPLSPASAFCWVDKADPAFASSREDDLSATKRGSDN